MTEQTQNTGTGPNPVRRRRRILAIAIAVAVLAGAYGIKTWIAGDVSRGTDDAYVNGHSVLLTPQIAGVVTAIRADDTDQVKAGDTLVNIDPSDAQIELDAAEAQLAQAMRTVRGQYASVERAAADVQVAQTALDRARADLKERQGIANSGAITGEEVRHAQDSVNQAEAVLTAAEKAKALALTQTQGLTTIDDHPAIRAATQRLRAAALAIERTRIVAPVSGMVSQRRAQVGRRVSPGDALLSIVPLDQLWVDANFKEVQLDKICAGQAATLTADVYGSSVRYHGTVEGIEAGSGAAFALLPAQNATGNWIKVVQRVPLRISIDPKDLASHPLRVGVSMRATVDVESCARGVATGTTAAPSDETAIYDAQIKAADARVAKVISAIKDAASN
jgi:membrane fusion protein (multidrug efflux system)